MSGSILDKAKKAVETVEKVVGEVEKDLGVADTIIGALEAYKPNLIGDKAQLEKLLKEAELAGAKTLVDVIIYFLQK